MTHILLLTWPKFLELNDYWVDNLLDVEKEIEDDDGQCCLTYLFASD